MLLQTNSYIVPRDKREEHARLVRKFRQVLLRLGCDSFEVYEQVGTNWAPGEATGRYVQIMRFHDRKHQQAVQAAEKADKGAQHVIREFCELINFPYQHQHGLFASGFYQSIIAPAPARPASTTRPRPRSSAPIPPPPPVAGSSASTTPAEPANPAMPSPADPDEDEPRGGEPPCLEGLLQPVLEPSEGRSGTTPSADAEPPVEGEISPFNLIEDDTNRPDVVEGEETFDTSDEEDRSTPSR